MADHTELTRKMERVEHLVQSLESCPDPEVREQSRELLATLMDFHQTALGRALEILRETAENPKAVVEALARDPLAGGLLLMYGLHPAGVEARVNEALEQVRPALHAHQGDVELIRIEEKAVHLRLKGTCNGCPSSTSTFRNLIESAIQDRAPEIDQVHVEGIAAA